MFLDAGPYRSGEHLSQRPWIAFVCSRKRAEVVGPSRLVDDRWRYAGADEYEIRSKAAHATVAVSEWMDALERRM